MGSLAGDKYSTGCDLSSRRRIRQGYAPRGDRDQELIRRRRIRRTAATKGTGAHQYVLTLYALKDAKLDLKPDATLPEFQAAVKGKILGEASITGLFGNKTAAFPKPPRQPLKNGRQYNPLHHERGNRRPVIGTSFSARTG